MEYRTLGRTREKVSMVGMGTWNMGNIPRLRSDEIRSLRRGLELGMNLIDTAEMYASGGAELVVGEALKGLRDSAFIASKVSPGNLRYDDVISACEGSLRRLGTDHIDLYQVHWPNPGIPLKDTMRAMEKLVDDGMIRFIGVSNFDIRLVEEARASLAKYELASDQVSYSLKDRSAEQELIPFCQKEGISVIAYTPISKGRIPESAELRDVAEKYGLSPVQVALNWVTRSVGVFAIPKAAQVHHVEENATSVSKRFGPEEYRLISKG